ncbi:MAG: hypothetical protein V1866_00185 [archaeon]
MAKETAQALKVKKKKWFSIIAPPMFRETVVGEIPLYESEEMKGRYVTVNMMNLTGNPKNQHISVKLRIQEVKEGKGYTQLLGFEMLPTSVKRFVRRGKSKIDDSFIIQTSDRKLVRIKPLLITNSLAKNSAVSNIRRVVRNALARYAVRITYDHLIEEIFTFKLQKHVGGLACKVTPIKTCEIRSFALVEKEGVKPITPKDIQTTPEEAELAEEFEPENEKESKPEASNGQNSDEEFEAEVDYKATTDGK